MIDTVPSHPETEALIKSFAQIKSEQEDFARRISEAMRPQQALIDRIAEEQTVFARMAEKFNPILERLRGLDEVSRFHRKLQNADTTLAVLRQLTDSQVAFEKAFAPIRDLAAVLEKIQTYHVPSVTLFAPDTADLVAHIARGSGYDSAAYRGFFKLKKAEAAVVADVKNIPPSTATLPSRESFLAGQSAVAAQTELRESFPDKLKPEGQNSGLVIDLDEAFKRELSTLDAELIKLLVGAKAVGAIDLNQCRDESFDSADQRTKIAIAESRCLPVNAFVEVIEEEAELCDVDLVKG